MEYLKDQALKKLNYYYYGCMFLAIVLVSVMFYVSRGENPILPHLDRASSLGYALQTVVILSAVVGIPSGLGLFQKKCKMLKTQEDSDAKYHEYIKWGSIRIILVGSPLIFGIVAFYWLGAYRSMIWVAGMGAIFLYSCKPLKQKIESDLKNDDTEAENA